jgi:hypothetical protein
VAVDVVHGLEIVQVEEGDGDRRAAADGASEREFELLPEPLAVGQLGELS